MAEATDRLATTTRSAIRVVIRGMSLPEGAQFNVGELRILIVTRAKPSDWPELQGDEHIVAVRLDFAA